MALIPMAAFAAVSYGNSDGTARMSVTKWGNNYALVKGTQRAYGMRKVYTQGQARNVMGSESWKRVSPNTVSLRNQSRSFTVINTNYTFTKIRGVSLRLCTDVPFWFDPCGKPVTINR